MTATQWQILLAVLTLLGLGNISALAYFAGRVVQLVHSTAARVARLEDRLEDWNGMERRTGKERRRSVS